MTMPEPESEWLNVSFDFKIVGADFEWPPPGERKELLRNLVRALAWTLLPDSDYTGVKVFTGNLKLKQTTLFSDELLDRVLSDWEESSGDEP
jgi:hypothetical protein